MTVSWINSPTVHSALLFFLLLSPLQADRPHLIGGVFLSSLSMVNPIRIERPGLTVDSGDGCAIIKVSLDLYTPFILAAKGSDTQPLSTLIDASNRSPVAAINGLFFYEGGILGPFISERVPLGEQKYNEIISRFPRSFFCWDGKRRRMFLGSSSLGSRRLLEKLTKRGLYVSSLLGGGGWLIRKGRAVMARYYREQGFSKHFCFVRSAPRSALGVDRHGKTLFLITFSFGLTLDEISKRLVSDPRFKGLYDCLFLDGGGSTVFTYGDIYLQRPVYLLERPLYNAVAIQKRRSGK